MVVDRHLKRAFELAHDSIRTHPNPRVGAVVVSADGEVVGEGWHEGPGTKHAEVMALANAGDAANGATVYVSLEPCNHHGRTKPCTDALIEAGVSRYPGGRWGRDWEVGHRSGLGEQLALLPNLSRLLDEDSHAPEGVIRGEGRGSHEE